MIGAALIYSDRLLGYDFGPAHPLRPIRLKMTCELIGACGLLDNPGSRLLDPRPAAEHEILAAHDPDYVEAVRRLSVDPSAGIGSRFGFDSSDNPAFPGMFEASCLYSGASAHAAGLVAGAETRIVFSISGGLHHAHRARASGFCVFNDPVIAIHRLLEKFERVAYIDIDAHHGDGVQEAFYDTDRVLTISIHESGQWLFPGTGSVDEVGSGRGRGCSVNIPLAPFSGDWELERAFEQVILPVIDRFSPQVIVAQLGVDGHAGDPIAHLVYTSHGWLAALRRVMDFGLPIVALGGGGYDVRTVARLWTLAYADMLGIEVPDAAPREIADKYQIHRLHDTMGPSIPKERARAARRYLDENIDRLRRLLGI